MLFQIILSYVQPLEYARLNQVDQSMDCREPSDRIIT